MRRILASLGVVLGLFIVSAVAAMTVQPVVVDMKMTGREMSAPVRVENNGPNPLPVEIRIVETDFGPDSVRASDRLSEDVVAFPPQAIIPPGETQVFRLQYLGDPGSFKSKHYYAEVAQLPVELPEGQSAIQILYNFQVMVNVASPIGGDPVLTIEDASVVQNDAGKNVIAFTVRNAARNYGYLSANRLTFVYRDAAGQEVLRRTLTSNDIQQMIGFGLVGPEMSRRFISPIEVDTADGKAEVSLASSRGR
ncbi:molecular chaperone [Brevundimonas lenta]|uniref:P pilus assembly chaperone PapD n=1 Tax=Brevundimonas lenta TaxID=424796 RepID=A0A7W6JC05_9CAUL|nr:molecular chaperone [Brevundimonas lenta]MBB4082329.1 P pilus assembly chaperone PapD [Brevundimonas lenta]